MKVAPGANLPDRLTADAIDSARAREKAFKVFDGGGLYLLVTPTGSRHWRVKYRYGGKERTHALGSYPNVSLSEARDGRDALRGFLAAGGDPSSRVVGQAASPFLLAWSDAGVLTIHAEGKTFRLTPARVGALRAFLNASEV